MLYCAAAGAPFRQFGTNMSSERKTAASDAAFLAGGGAVGKLMRTKRWHDAPLGPPDSWPQSLKTVVRILLTSRYQMWMCWGPELTMFYNDAYGPTLGVKQQWALGSSAREVWKEIWPDIGPRIERVLQSGEATWDEALLLFLERSGYPEETYLCSMNRATHISPAAAASIQVIPLRPRASIRRTPMPRGRRKRSWCATRR